MNMLKPTAKTEQLPTTLHDTEVCNLKKHTTITCVTCVCARVCVCVHFFPDFFSKNHSACHGGSKNVESTQSSKIGRIHTIESQLYYRSPPRYPMTVDTYRGRGTLGFDRRSD